MGKAKEEKKKYYLRKRDLCWIILILVLIIIAFFSITQYENDGVVNIISLISSVSSIILAIVAIFYSIITNTEANNLNAQTIIKINEIEKVTERINSNTENIIRTLEESFKKRLEEEVVSGDISSEQAETILKVADDAVAKMQKEREARNTYVHCLSQRNITMLMNEKSYMKLVLEVIKERINYNNILLDFRIDYGKKIDIFIESDESNFVFVIRISRNKSNSTIILRDKLLIIKALITEKYNKKTYYTGLIFSTEFENDRIYDYSNDDVAVKQFNLTTEEDLKNKINDFLNERNFPDKRTE